MGVREDEAVPLRVGTANVLHGIDIRTGRVDLGAVAAGLAALGCDVLALQEVDRGLPRSGGEDQAAVLGERLGMETRFAPALLGDPDDRWTAVGADADGHPGYGVALLSRLPVLGAVRTVLPGGGAGQRRSRSGDERASAKPGWDREPRTALTVRLDTGAGAELRFTTLHLSYLPWRGMAQLRRAAAVARAADGAPAILAGDCNLPVRPVRALLGRAWSHAGGAPTYPAWKPRMQVDQIAVTGGVAVSSVAVRTVESSDHLAVVADVAIPAP